MKVKSTYLRQNLYKILDEVLESGSPVEIERNGQILLIQPKLQKDNLSKLKKRKITNGSPESLLDLDWSEEWSETKKKKK